MKPLVVTTALIIAINVRSYQQASIEEILNEVESITSLIKMLSNIPPRKVKDFIWLLLALLNKIIYWGKNYQCPICNSNIRLFSPLPANYRVDLKINNHIYTVNDYETLNVTNYMCPVCHCSDRERLYALYLKKEKLNEDKLLVHFAPEKALSKYIRRLSKYNYRTVDLNMKDVDEHLDITKLDAYKSDSIDCFICSHILEHIDSDIKALRELFRVLKPQGWGIIMVPVIAELNMTYEDHLKITEEQRLKYFGHKDHVRVYGKNDFIQRLKYVGFTVNQLGVDYFGNNAFKIFGITEKSVLFVVHKH